MRVLTRALAATASAVTAGALALLAGASGAGAQAADAQAPPFIATFGTPTPPLMPGNGALFGLAVAPGGAGVYFVDDDSNTLNFVS